MVTGDAAMLDHLTADGRPAVLVRHGPSRVLMTFLPWSIDGLQLGAHPTVPSSTPGFSPVGFRSKR